MQYKVGFLVSHPIQYYSPWFRALSGEMTVSVFYAHRQTAKEQGLAGFGIDFDWDIDLLSGYHSSFLNNIAARPGVDRFFGCDTPELQRIIANGDFDAFIVLGWQLKCYWQAVRACRRCDVPVLVRGDSQLATYRPPLKTWVKALAYPRILRLFDGFLFVGERNREYLRHYCVPNEKMFFVPHFVDNQWFAERVAMARGERVALRLRWGAAASTLVVLFVGKLIPKKRPADLLTALSIIRDAEHSERRSNDWRARDILVIFVGAGELEQDLRREAHRLRLPIQFLGFKNQSELPAIYGAADAIVLPSDGAETWGLVINEAMACGLPAIVSEAVGCGPDLIVDGVTGFRFETGNSTELAEKLVALQVRKLSGVNFAEAVNQHLKTYSIATAVSGTIAAVAAVVE